MSVCWPSESQGEWSPVTLTDLLAIRQGDWVRLDGLEGEVAFCAPAKSYGPDFPAEDWTSCDGLMIRMPNGALVHYGLDSFDGVGRTLWGPKEQP